MEVIVIVPPLPCVKEVAASNVSLFTVILLLPLKFELNTSFSLVFSRILNNEAAKLTISISKVYTIPSMVFDQRKISPVLYPSSRLFNVTLYS